jgi:hypothetical protein
MEFILCRKYVYGYDFGSCFFDSFNNETWVACCRSKKHADLIHCRSQGLALYCEQFCFAGSRAAFNALSNLTQSLLSPSRILKPQYSGVDNIHNNSSY